MEVSSRYVLDRKVSLYLLIYVLHKNKLSESQQEVIGKMNEMDGDLHNLSKLVFPNYTSQWPTMARLQIPHLESALRERFPELAQLTVKHLLGGAQFRTWLGHQVARFGEWLDIDPKKE